MTTDISTLIPAEAVEAALRERYDKIWRELSEGQRENLRFVERAAIAAMLKAWPGVLHQGDNETTIVCQSALILPLPTEPSK